MKISTKGLNDLEEKTFGSAKKGDLAQRTDALKAKISMMKPSSTPSKLSNRGILQAKQAQKTINKTILTGNIHRK